MHKKLEKEYGNQLLRWVTLKSLLFTNYIVILLLRTTIISAQFHYNINLTFSQIDNLPRFLDLMHLTFLQGRSLLPVQVGSRSS